MNIKSFQLTSITLPDLEFEVTKPICVIRGDYSELILDLIRETVGDYGAVNDPDRIDDGRFVINSNIEMDGKNYSLCYIRNADFLGDHRIAVNFAPRSVSFSEDDTAEFLSKRAKLNSTDENVFSKTLSTNSQNLSETERRITDFEDLINRLSPNDTRPIFIYSLFDRIDSGVDISKYINTLLSLNKQVFISVCKEYSTKKFEYADIQILSLT